MDNLVPILYFVAPMLLFAAIIWAWARNRNTSAATDRKAEEGARNLREDIEQDRHGNMDL